MCHFHTLVSAALVLGISLLAIALTWMDSFSAVPLQEFAVMI